MTTSDTMPATGTSGRSLNAEAQRPGFALRLLNSTRIHPAYRLAWIARLSLLFRFYWNRIVVGTATSPKAQLAMVLKLLEMPPEIPGVVVQCGTWKGGTVVNLSLVCRLVGRRLWIYESIQGPASDDVKRNLARYGAPEVCTFKRGCLDKMLPELSTPVVLAYIFVAQECSRQTCLLHLRRNLERNGYLFDGELESTGEGEA